MRDAFADEVTALGNADPNIVLLSGDIGNRMFDKFKEKNEGRFVNCGIAEANMMGTAAGLALSGLRPVIYTIAPFTTTRCLEQIRVDACYHNVPIVIVGTGAGLTYAQLGPTHHSCEDIAILRVLPNMTVLCPCDAVEVRLALRAALQASGPVYIRIGKKGEPIVHTEAPHFKIGKAITIRQGDDVCLISTGNIMPVVQEASDRLHTEGISARVESFHSVKPLDTQRLGELFNQYSVVMVVEEHSRIGGLASAVAEWMAAQESVSGRLLSVGVDDAFMHEVGSQDYAREKYGLTSENIVQQILAAYKKFPD